jgi:hypothetical protein
MHDQGNQDEDQRHRRQIERQTDNLVLSVMLREESWPWSVEEIGRELANQAEARDAVCRLAENGLVHRLGDFVFPTRAARRGAAIEIGTA